MAGKIGLSSKATLERLRNLKKKGFILGLNALIDSEKIGYYFYKIDFYLNNLTRIKEMHAFAKYHKKIAYLMKTIGGPDYEIEVYVKSADEVKEIVNEIKEKFPGVVEFSRVHLVEKTLKQVYLPGEHLNKK